MNARTLVVGYGNELRGDDGVGPAVAREVGAWEHPEVDARAVHQLLPELGAELALADVVVFVDASVEPAEELQVSLLGLADCPRLGHTCDPRWLLGLTEMVFGNRPTAWLITIPVSSLGHGEVLSSLAQTGKAAALERIARLIDRTEQAEELLACTRSA